jgi:hypothetical protein
MYFQSNIQTHFPAIPASDIFEGGRGPSVKTCTFAKVTATTVRNLAVNFGVKDIVKLKKRGVVERGTF